MDGAHQRKVAVLLVARSAVAAAPIADMRAIADRVAALPGVDHTAFGFTEIGAPTLRDALLGSVGARADEILLLPLLVPMEPSFQNWITRAVARWKAADGRPWPPIRLAPPPVTAAASPTKMPPEAALIPAQKRRVLICLGGPCNNAGGTAIWSYWRREQDRLQLRTAGEGLMSCKTSCLGPCELAPVVQVFPEGTYYGGVDEATVDRIITEHIQRGRVVEEFAYSPNGRKQALRTRATDDRSIAEGQLQPSTN
jgi:(2Fe-2S) ferredoxin